jgi:hypothetical protein
MYTSKLVSNSAVLFWHAEAKLAPILPALYEGLVQLLKESTEETQHLVLETLEVVIKMDSNCVVQQVRMLPVQIGMTACGFTLFTTCTPFQSSLSVCCSQNS